MDPIITFLCSPLGIIVALIAAAFVGRFLWHIVVFALEFALVAAIIGLVVYGLGGFDGIAQRPCPVQQHQATYHAARRI